MNDTWWISDEDLDEDQYKVIELPPDGNYLVTGPPGSGKTNLLLLRGKFLSLAGHPNISVVVLTRSLRDFIASGASRYGLESANVHTSLHFYREFLREHGAVAEYEDSFEKARAHLVQRVDELIEANGIGHTYDAILLDEAQDFLAEEIHVFAKLAVRLFAVADPHQKIYRTSDAIGALRQHAEPHVLRHHYRNGLSICRFADAIAMDTAGYEPMERLAAYDEAARPSSVEEFSVTDDAAQVALLVERIFLQIRAYPQELIGILVPLSRDAEQMWELLRESELRNVISYGTDEGVLRSADTGLVLLSNIHTAKGLEYRAVHIANAEGLKKFPNSRNLAFTAATRAKTSLSIYHTKPLPSFVVGALAKTRPLPRLPRVRDLFER